ncbi:hypothetical protein COCCADRAFT_89968 [Bipolaris zeicola 26-R-13]|uniref:Uncharacterized protein n=1 Tax=Cochliobolus carbonum (strain 26-R-13) TaxID=930089 RepID=W6YDT5_COCC2|nr:uncharacterized protein COCCADRAFT_89968 [Bipolaris zeicola 26-R-13]EUC35800.1 hypothetical protein COCCADRAFT_89968 [Bipolaris zeicola 26-R-13]
MRVHSERERLPSLLALEIASPEHLHVPYTTYTEHESNCLEPLGHACVLLTGLSLRSALLLRSHVLKPCPNLGTQGSTVETIALLAF